MKTVILAGGLGTRLAEETGIRPKPMVEIGGYPILWHILNIYAAHGFNDFIIAAGYKGQYIKAYFCDFWRHAGDVIVDLKTGSTEIRNSKAPDWKVTVVDTGSATQTGGRIQRLQPYLGDEPFMVTYGDGVGNIDLKALVNFHKKQKRIATITAVRPPSRFGGLVFNGDEISIFADAPQISEGWINGGFMVMEPQIFKYLSGDKTCLEHDPMESLARDHQLVAYKHEGFWQPMDTIREKQILESLWNEGKAPWKIW